MWPSRIARTGLLTLPLAVVASIIGACACCPVTLETGPAPIGTCALFVGVLLFVTTGGAGPAAVLCAYVVGQVAFSVASIPLRDPAVRGVSRFYRELGQGQLVPEEHGLGWSGALLR